MTMTMTLSAHTMTMTMTLSAPTMTMTAFQYLENLVPPLSGAQISLLTSLMSPFPQRALLSPHQLLPLSSQLMSQVPHPHILPLLQQIALPYRRLS